MNTEARLHVIIDSKLGSLRLTTFEHSNFGAERKELFKKYYLLERKACGIWASNQGRYVKSFKELNDWDDKQMERDYARSTSKGD